MRICGTAVRTCTKSGAPNSNLLPNAQLAERWAEERGLRGRVLGLGEAGSLATKEWLSLAEGASEGKPSDVLVAEGD
jgi:hypothetical protein